MKIVNMKIMLDDIQKVCYKQGEMKIGLDGVVIFCYKWREMRYVRYLRIANEEE